MRQTRRRSRRRRKELTYIELLNLCHIVSFFLFLFFSFNSAVLLSTSPLSRRYTESSATKRLASIFNEMLMFAAPGRVGYACPSGKGFPGGSLGAERTRLGWQA